MSGSFTVGVVLSPRGWSGPLHAFVADHVPNVELVVIRDRRVAVSYMVEALRIFDHYHFRVVHKQAKKAKRTLHLAKPPRQAGEEAWFADDYSDPRKIRDRELFA